MTAAFWALFGAAGAEVPRATGASPGAGGPGAPAGGPAAARAIGPHPDGHSDDFGSPAPGAHRKPPAEAWIAAPVDLRAVTDVPGVTFGEQTRWRDGRLEVRVLADPAGLERLRSAGHRIVELGATGGPTGFPGPEDGDARLTAAADRADQAGIARFGTSVEGRPLLAMWIGRVPGSAPSYRILAAHHGDEVASAEVALALADRLASPGDPVVDAVLARATVWIVPYVNPDGAAAGTRENARGVDLNRNYDWEWAADTLRPGERPFSEPETRAVRASVAFERPIASLTLHAGAANIGWPWNFTVDAPEDAPVFEELAGLYAGAVGDPEFWTTQGGDWYVTHGDTNDWAYGRHGGLDFTVEIGVDPRPGDLEVVVPPQVEAIVAFLAVPPAVAGTVVDADSGAPIEATVAVSGPTGGGTAPFPSDAATGAFARVLPSGVPPPYTVAIAAPGYASVEGQVTEPGGVVALAPAGLADGRVTPTVVWEATPIEVPGGSGTLVLPGYAPIPVSSGDVVDPARISPGAWSVVLGSGEVLPRAVVVEDANTAAIAAWDADADALWVEGSGFGEGARAYALAGRERAPVEVPVVVDDEALVHVPIGALPDDDPVDLVLWTNGSLLGIADSRTPGIRETEVPGLIIGRGACGCVAVDPVPGHIWSAVGSILVVAASAVSRRFRP